MILYLLYRLGHYLAVLLPLNASYFFACAIADLHYYISFKDRRAVMENLKVIFGEEYDKAELRRISKGVFRNFAKYLADFFRFSKLDADYIKRHVKVEGAENIDAALVNGKGAIMLSAHIGNWELGASAISLLGYPLNAVVLTHQNARINDFFTKQRRLGKVRPIEIGMGLRNCYCILKKNGLLALLGDRDFSKNGIWVEFFGKKTLIPKGPAVFSNRIGSAIVPAFMIRERDDNYRLIMEKPIFPNNSGNSEEAVISLIRKYLPVLESYIKRYPTQWYVFRNEWNSDEKDLRPDTIL